MPENLSGPAARLTIEMCRDRILGSDAFARSERSRDFLRYVVDCDLAGKGDKLKGYTIAVDVFGRPASFNADSDPLVRVHAVKLRKLLDLYYETEGAADTWRIAIPKGSYAPVYLPVGDDTGPMEHMETVRDAQPEGTTGDTMPERSSPPPMRRPWHLSRSWSSPVAIISTLLPVVLLMPFNSTAVSGKPASIETHRAAQSPALELPRIRIATPAPGNAAAAGFANGLKNAAARYPTLSDMESARFDAASPSTLSFTVNFATRTGSDDLVVSLIHDASMQTVSELLVASSRLADEADTLYETITVAYNWFSMDGDLYRFATDRRILSDLMRCMITTETYRRQQTRETFGEARSCQQSLVPARKGETRFQVNASRLATSVNR